MNVALLTPTGVESTDSNVGNFTARDAGATWETGAGVGDTRTYTERRQIAGGQIYNDMLIRSLNYTFRLLELEYEKIC